MTTDRQAVDLAIDNGQECLGTSFHRIGDSLWTLSIRRNKDGKFLEVQCNSVEQHKYWDCYFSATVQKMTRDGESVEEIEGKQFSNYTTKASILPLEEDVNKVIVKFKCEKMQAYDFPNSALFDRPVEHISDICLIVEGQKLYACKKILETYSSYFEKVLRVNMIEYKIDDTTCNLFRVFLGLLCGQNNLLTVDNVQKVSKLSKIFEAEHCLEECEKFLIKVNKSAEWKMEVANGLGFKVLYYEMLSKYQTVDQVMELVDATKFYQLEPNTKIAIYERLAKLKGGYSNLENLQFYQRSVLLTESRKHLSDVVLSVGTKQFYVSKQLLAYHSSYFYALFYSNFKEKQKNVIELKEIDADQFEIFLQFIHYPNRFFDKGTIEVVLMLSQMYDAKIVIKNCENYLRKEEGITDVVKIEMAEKYVLPQLFDNIATKIKTQQDYINLSKMEGFERLSLETLGKISKYLLSPSS